MKKLSSFSRNSIDPKTAIATLVLILLITIWLIFWLFPSPISGFSVKNFDGNWRCDVSGVIEEGVISLKKDNRYIEIDTNEKSVSMVQDMIFNQKNIPNKTSSLRITTELDAVFNSSSIELLKQHVIRTEKQKDDLKLINDQVVSTLIKTFEEINIIGKVTLFNKDTIHISNEGLETLKCEKM